MTEANKQEKYDGCSCPSCHSLHIDGGAVEIEPGEAWQDCSCTECDASWTNFYKLSRIEVTFSSQ